MNIALYHTGLYNSLKLTVMKTFIILIALYVLIISLAIAA